MAKSCRKILHTSDLHLDIVLELESTDLCPNCSKPLHGPFCFNCGQQQRNINRFFLTLVSEAFEDLFSLNSRTTKTLFNLMIRPGFLTNEYSAGRQARYIPSLRLYLITIFLLVLFISLHNIFVEVGGGEAEIRTVNEHIIIRDDDGTESEFTQEDFNKNVTEQIKEMQFSWLSETNNRTLRVLLKDQSEKVFRIIREDPGDLRDILLDLIPPTMFLLLPLFALLLKITYMTSGRYYTEHLVLALHSHPFLFLSILVINLMELLAALPAVETIVGSIILLIEIWIPLYLLIALKTFYGEGIAVTLFKYIFLSIAYFMLLSPLMTIAVMWGFLTL